MEPVLTVHLFGSFRLKNSRLEDIPLNSARLQSLLAFILLHRQGPISRQTLSAVFWPNTSDTQSRTNLRNLLYQLRQTLPMFDQILRVEKNSIEWVRQTGYTLDVEAFENALVMERGSVVTKEALECAVNIYEGPLLPDCYDDWVSPIRQRLQEIYLNALEALAVMAEQSRQYSAALGYIRRLLAVDELHSNANLQLVRLSALCGDRPAALKAYQTYKRLLLEELGTEPEAEIKKLYERLLRSEEAGEIQAENQAVTLVGRQLEWHKLLACCYSAVGGGRAQVVFVRGEAGIGKTRLVEEFVIWAQRQGIFTAVANCYAAEGSPSLDPLVGWLRSLPFPRLDKHWLVELGRLLPEVYEKVPNLPASEPLREAWQRQRFFEGLARALLTQQELILVLEDCQWVDQDTLEWLHYLLRFAPQARLLVVATIRSGETGPDHPLHKLRQTLRSTGRCLDLDIHPLNDPEANKLALLMAKSSSAVRLNREMAARICQEAEGNPLFIIEMVRLGQAAVSLSEAALKESEKIQVVLEQRFTQLKPSTSNLMALAATIGRSFNLDVLLKSCIETDEVVLHAIEDLLYRKIIREISPTEYDFTHDLLRKAAFDRLSTAHRRLLHRRVAEAYLQLAGKSPYGLARSAEIASHFDQAGLLAEAVLYYCQAAEADALIFANAEAENYLQRAAILADQLGPIPAPGITSADFARLYERLGDLLLMNGKYIQAVAAFEKSLNVPLLKNPIIPDHSINIWRSRIYCQISEAWLPQYQHALADAALNKADQLVQEYAEASGSTEQRQWVRVQLTRLQFYYFANRPTEMKVIIETLSPLIQGSGQLDLQEKLLTVEIQMRLRLERFRTSRETVAICWRRLELAEQLNDPSELALAQFQHGFQLLWYDDLAVAQEWLQKGCDGLTRVGNTIWRVRALSYLSIIRRKLGQLDGLQAFTQQLVKEAEAIGEHTYYGIGLANLGWLAWKVGDPDQAEYLCTEARAAWAKFGGCVFQSICDWVLLAISVDAKKLQDAEQIAQRLLDPNPYFQPLRPSAAALVRQALNACQEHSPEKAYAWFAQAIGEAHATREL